jgi:hypothetical protein
MDFNTLDRQSLTLAAIGALCLGWRRLRSRGVRCPATVAFLAAALVCYSKNLISSLEYRAEVIRNPPPYPVKSDSFDPLINAMLLAPFYALPLLIFLLVDSVEYVRRQKIDRPGSALAIWIFLAASSPLLFELIVSWAFRAAR